MERERKSVGVYICVSVLSSREKIKKWVAQSAARCVQGGLTTTKNTLTILFRVEKINTMS